MKTLPRSHAAFLSATKMRFILVLVVMTSITSIASATITLDFIDDFLSPSGGTNQTVPGSYDVVNGNDQSISPDGIIDFTVTSMTTGLGDDGNNVEWDATMDVNGTGLRSSIDPSFIDPGGVTSNAAGHRVTQMIQIDFGPGIEVFSEGVKSFGWSSGNTAGVVWEVSILEYLDVNGNPFSPTPTIDPYATHSAINGMSGTGTWVADDLAAVTMVGSDLTAAGANGPLNSLNTDGTPGTSGIASGTLLGGVKLTHIIEDVRGVNNGDTVFTNTINELNLNLKATVPEPGNGVLLGLAMWALFGLRRR